MPLRDRDGRPATYTLSHDLVQELHQIDRHAWAEVDSADQVTPDNRDRYLISSLMEEAIASSQLEGASTSRLVAKEMLRSGRAPTGIGERMIVNNFNAMEWIRSAVRNEPLTPATVFHLHEVLTEGTLDDPDAAGRFRRADEPIRVFDQTTNEVLHDPPLAGELGERLDRLCAFANGEPATPFVHPVVRAIVVHYWLAYDHPFVDGNGRTARALFYWCMLRNGYDIAAFLSISTLIRQSPARYARAYLHCETDDNDLTYFLLYHLELLSGALDNLRTYLRQKAREIREVERLTRQRADLNHRQLALIGHALRHPDAVYTFRSHQTSHGVVYQTARNDLLDLVHRGLLEQFKRGREAVFAPVAALEKRLGQARVP